MRLSEAQQRWLESNPLYETLGSPRANVIFKKVGTLFADGKYVELASGMGILLEQGCVGVGIRKERLEAALGSMT